ncbi:MAG: hypothetical protein L0H96_04125 [Humibacillus sp.]|nr:hypothetical protein [Humibacillus sp.]MDN5776076.1 hypothetical protein [Humibacillus sp.]
MSSRELGAEGGDLVAVAAAFVFELGGQDPHDGGGVTLGRVGHRVGGFALLGAEGLDPGAERWVGVKEVDRDPGGAGDVAEVDRLALFLA